MVHFPLMQFYFRAAKNGSGSKNIGGLSICGLARISYAVVDVRNGSKLHGKRQGRGSKRKANGEGGPYIVPRFEILLDQVWVTWSGAKFVYAATVTSSIRPIEGLRCSARMLAGRLLVRPTAARGVRLLASFIGCIISADGQSGSGYFCSTRK